ncbi:unnamed protein product [Acanthoscelides obtectus]|uniref:Reverse transcriptase domain-containing protein n=1 Tax=Acanthoscelides obtectus TaxID=200917 RepID=A0A9P0MC42_ACAOB|nr:unnamed protein product [Acanthoscelides obtectus]CAK1621633.1 hypothetical protein AOBTE_LOCUS1052 [Acanthoscelides obtectus]
MAAVPLEEEFWRFQEISLSKLRKTVFQLKKKSTGDEALTCSLVNQLFDVNWLPPTPSLLKRSIIVPVPKTNNPRKPEDLRPISLMPVVDKVIEITVHEQLSEHLRVNDVPFERQSGFRRNHYCETARQFVCTKWKKDVDDGKVIVCVCQMI